MADLMTDIRNLLISSNLLTAKQLFYTTMPPIPDGAVSFREYSSSNAGFEMYNRSFQFVSRDLNDKTAEDRAKAILSFLKSQNQVVFNQRPIIMNIKQTVSKYDTDNRGRHRYVFSVSFLSKLD